jgi:hypothetical protein
VRHTKIVSLEVDFIADGLFHTGSAVQGSTAITTVSVRVAGWRWRVRSRSWGRVGKGSEESKD